MDNDTKLSRSQLESVLSRLSGAEKTDINDFIDKNLNEQQTQALNRALENPELIKGLLSSPQAQALVKKIISGKRD